MKSFLAFSGQAEDDVGMEDGDGSLSFKTELGKQSSGSPAEAAGIICCHIQQLHGRDMFRHGKVQLGMRAIPILGYFPSAKVHTRSREKTKILRMQ